VVMGLDQSGVSSPSSGNRGSRQTDPPPATQRIPREDLASATSHHLVPLARFLRASRWDSEAGGRLAAVGRARHLRSEKSRLSARIGLQGSPPPAVARFDAPGPSNQPWRIGPLGVQAPRLCRHVRRLSAMAEGNGLNRTTTIIVHRSGPRGQAPEQPGPIAPRRPPHQNGRSRAGEHRQLGAGAGVPWPTHQPQGGRRLGPTARPRCTLAHSPQNGTASPVFGFRRGSLHGQSGDCASAWKLPLGVDPLPGLFIVRGGTLYKPLLLRAFSRGGPSLQWATPISAAVSSQRRSNPGSRAVFQGLIDSTFPGQVLLCSARLVGRPTRGGRAGALA